MMKPKINDILEFMEKSKYVVYTKPYQLNIVGIRSKTNKPNEFDDTINVFYKDDKGKWVFKSYPATTDIGTFWLLYPMNTAGGALLKAGQYVDAYARDYHREYLALTQKQPVTVYRDYNRNAVFDMFTKTQKGLFGINIHKAGENSFKVDKYSAGCQVFKKSADFDAFMRLTALHSQKHGNKFTYTLIDERAMTRTARRYSAYGAIFICAVSVGAFLYTRKYYKG